MPEEHSTINILLRILLSDLGPKGAALDSPRAAALGRLGRWNLLRPNGPLPVLCVNPKRNARPIAIHAAAGTSETLPEKFAYGDVLLVLRYTTSRLPHSIG